MDNGIDTDVLRKAMREITQEVNERLYEYFNDRSGGDKNG